LSRFEGEFLCDDPEIIHPDTDFKALGENEIGFPIYNLPRLIWFDFPRWTPLLIFVFLKVVLLFNVYLLMANQLSN